MKKSLYPLTELVKRWEREQLTTEQAVGQILMWLAHLSQRIAELEANQDVTQGPRVG